ncbi:hypothetical protein NV226_01470 [Mycoplasma iguanae]|uniref:Uncharacterized protein n=1 Tax=Mycoplasma iguanae TaxID=292461 RepID=A0ABY5R949_9MOLU|nr:hypothetical protein [Mycoplasma iguanae]UVD81958.1 hypothetical protein NV226_01470 [Mycoplasma iguanae]
MKLKNKILLSLTAVGVLSSAAFTSILVNHFKNYNGSNDGYLIYDPSAITKELKNEELEPLPAPAATPETNSEVKQQNPVILQPKPQPQPVSPEPAPAPKPAPQPRPVFVQPQQPTTPESAPIPERRIESKRPVILGTIRPSQDSDLDRELSRKILLDSDLGEIEEVNSLEFEAGADEKIPANERIFGGKGTHREAQGTFKDRNPDGTEFWADIKKS